LKKGRSGRRDAGRARKSEKGKRRNGGKAPQWFRGQKGLRPEEGLRGALDGFWGEREGGGRAKR